MIKLLDNAEKGNGTQIYTDKQNWNPPEMEEIEMLCMYLAEMARLPNP
jgi:hypothetical protein